MDPILRTTGRVHESPLLRLARLSSTERIAAIEPGNLELPDQLRFIGHELHEQLWSHHRSAGHYRAGFPRPVQLELLLDTARGTYTITGLMPGLERQQPEYRIKHFSEDFER